MPIRISGNYFEILRSPSRLKSLEYYETYKYNFIVKNENNIINQGTDLTEIDAIKQILYTVRYIDDLSHVKAYIYEWKYIKVNNVVNRYKANIEEIKICSCCRKPILKCEKYERVKRMYFHKRDCVGD